MAMCPKHKPASYRQGPVAMSYINICGYKSLNIVNQNCKKMLNKELKRKRNDSFNYKTKYWFLYVQK
jgi:hypothetical protein